MERARSTERRSWLKQNADEERGDPGTGGERAANALDRYSLALQLIQVFPVVSQAAILAVATTWLARALSGFCLLLGTAWVVYVERSRMRPRTRPDTKVTAVQDGPVLHTEVTSHDGELHIAISLHLRPPDPPAPRTRRDIAARRQIRHSANRRGPELLEREEKSGAVPPDGATVVMRRQTKESP